jgi:lysine-specific histone demethylase 1
LEYARQGILAAYSSRLNPYALHPGEYSLLREHITRSQVTIYLNIRNGILRLWHRNPMVGVTKHEAAGCCKDARYFSLAQVAYDWLLRNGYINFGCVELSNTARSIPRQKAKGGRRRTIVVVGAGMSGLGCARQLENLIAHYGEKFTDDGERPPKVIVLEGRNRLGGRVYSHPFKKQAKSTLPAGLRCTAEMGAQIITGFEHGNPMNAIVRGQLGLSYHALRDNSVLYDYDGRMVDKRRDLMVERLYNDVLERAAVYRNKLPTVRTVQGEEQSIRLGQEPKEVAEGDDQLISSLEDSGVEVTVTDGNHVSANKSNENAAAGVVKEGGRSYQLAGSAANRPAAEAARGHGWELANGIEATQSLDLTATIEASTHPTLGETMDEGLRQYRDMLGLTPEDLRLFNWHHANLEYANAANVNSLSLGGWDQDIGNEFEGEHTEIIGGYSQVPRGLYQLPEPLDVRFKHAVRGIRYNTIASSPNGVPIVVECQNGEKIEADEVVLTTPLGVLKEETIKFNPPLPNWKTDCIKRMGFGLLNKVIDLIV